MKDRELEESMGVQLSIDILQLEVKGGGVYLKRSIPGQ